MKVYLAHPFKEQARGLDLMKKIQALGIEVINPFIRVEQKIYQDIINKHEQFSEKHARDIVENDLRKIEETDGIVAMVTGAASCGTHMEVFYGSRILHRPVFVLYEIEMETKFHPWYQYLTKPFRTESELLNALKEWIA